MIGGPEVSNSAKGAKLGGTTVTVTTTVGITITIGIRITIEIRIARGIIIIIIDLRITIGITTTKVTT
jgi:hypothetical protein